MPQVYVTSPDRVGEPPKQLKGFQKVVLQPGESELVRIRLDPRSFAHWSTARNRWVIAPGRYGVMVGSSSRDLRLRTQVSTVGGVVGR